MDNAGIAAVLQAYIRDNFDTCLEDLDQPWRETAVNSMQFVYLVFFIEERFGIEITDGMMSELVTLRDVVALIAAHRVCV